MTYDSRKHHRRSIRLKDYDYGQPGAYFVTICTHRHVRLFGDVMDGTMRLNGYGRMAETCWKALPVHFSHVLLDTYVVMPNHIHGIIVIVHDVGATHASPLPSPGTTAGKPFHDATGSQYQHRPSGPKAQSLGAMVGSFKSAVTKRINERCGTPGALLWQRGYYEHIIRNERVLDRIRRYIIENPLRWPFDKNFPDTER